MRRGTTPTHTFKTDIDLTGAEVIFITYQQFGKNILEKTISDIEVTAEKLVVRLTQTETLLFEERPDAPVRVQIRARWPNGGDAVASNIIQTTAKEILKEGEI